MENEILLPRISGVGVYNSDIQVKLRRGSLTPDRIVGTYEIELPTEDGGISFIDDKKYPILANHIIAAKPGQHRHTLLPYKSYYVHLNTVGTLSDRLNKLPEYIKLSDPNKVVRLMRDLIYIYINVPEGDLLLQSRILELIWQLESDCGFYQVAGTGQYSDTGDIISGALKYIDSHISANITLTELAASQHISPVYFHKLFKRTIGKTPYRCILEKKLALSKNQLIMTNKSCLDIALGLGFSSQSYFNYAFRKETGVSPRQFRKDWYSKYPE